MTQLTRDLIEVKQRLASMGGGQEATTSSPTPPPLVIAPSEEAEVRGAMFTIAQL